MLTEAAIVPLEIMQVCLKAMELQAELCQKGSKIAVSDVGVGIQCLKAGLNGASLNVFINTKYMKNQDTIDSFNDKADVIIKKGNKMADEIFADVISQLRK